MNSLIIWLMQLFLGKKEAGPLTRRIGGWMLRHTPGMLTCAEFEDFILEYHEDLLPQKVRIRFETHMQICPKCRVHFDSYVRAVALGKKVCEEDDRMPEDLPRELIGAILSARSRETIA